MNMAKIVRDGERQRRDLLKVAICAAIDLEHATRELSWSQPQLTNTNEFEIAATRIMKAARLLQSAVVMATTGKDIMDRDGDDVCS